MSYDSFPGAGWYALFIVINTFLCRECRGLHELEMYLEQVTNKSIWEKLCIQFGDVMRCMYIQFQVNVVRRLQQSPDHCIAQSRRNSHFTSR